MKHYVPPQSSRATTKRLDALAREIVFLRDRHTCQRCKRTTQLQWCHVHTRRIRSLRWNLHNSLLLCAGCHLHWHHHPLEAAQWFMATFPDRAEALSMLRRQTYKLDPEATRIYLDLEMEKLNATPSKPSRKRMPGQRANVGLAAESLWRPPTRKRRSTAAKL